MKNGCLTLGLLALVLGVIFAAFGGVYTVNETEQVLITQFGRLVGEPVREPGLHFKIPFLHAVNRIEKRALEWDGDAVDMPTKDKTYIIVNTFARWRIVDPVLYFQKFGDERRARSRLDDIIGSETRTAIAKHELIELVRTDKDRKPERDPTLVAEETTESKVGTLPAIRNGREKIAQEIQREAAKKLADNGIELLDVRFKRVNYNTDVLQRIYERMRSERQQIAQRFRSEGEGEAAKILGQKERDLFEIESASYKQVQTLKGEADAKAAEIYAAAYGQDAQAPEFYRFLKTLETYKSAIHRDTNIVLTTDSEFYRLLKNPGAGFGPSAGPLLPPPGTLPEPTQEEPAPPEQTPLIPSEQTVPPPPPNPGA